ncbi:MAG: sprT domain-containing protein [Flavobacteriaceae bacterium]|nr:sprT domain-containing protein [Flavobacteriaceae bacterium]
MSSFSSYLPENARAMCFDLIKDHKITIRVVNPRRTKHGDFRKFPDGRSQITLNKMENPYRFLITFVHEWAHWLVIQKSNFRTQPHGNLWKQTFKTLMLPFLNDQIFPELLLQPLARHMKSPKATLDADTALAVVLKKSAPANDKSFIFELESGTRFMADNGKTYILGHLRRKRYACVQEATGRTYLFAAHGEVQVVNNDKSIE